jgi:hypothetical protein
MTGHRRNQPPRRIDLEGKQRHTAGWEFVHIAIDDCTRLAYAEVLSDEKASTAVAFLRRPGRSIDATASRCRSCSPITAGPTSQRLTQLPAGRLASGI